MPDDCREPLQIRDDIAAADPLLAEMAWTWGEHRAAMFRYFAAELQQAAPQKLPPWAARLLCRWSIEALR